MALEFFTQESVKFPAIVLDFLRGEAFGLARSDIIQIVVGQAKKDEVIGVRILIVPV
jgi:hypothetical protein